MNNPFNQVYYKNLNHKQNATSAPDEAKYKKLVIDDIVINNNTKLSNNIFVTGLTSDNGFSPNLVVDKITGQLRLGTSQSIYNDNTYNNPFVNDVSPCKYHSYYGAAGTNYNISYYNSNLDTNFNVNRSLNGDVQSILELSDGRYIVGGSFTSYNSDLSNKITILNNNGNLSQYPKLGFNGVNNCVIKAMAIQYIDGTERIVCGGNFTLYNGETYNNIIRLNLDLSIDYTFNIGTGFNDTVNDIKVQSDNKIIVVGDFTTYSGINSNRIIRLNKDGSIDNSFVIGLGFDATVKTICIDSENKILCGGSFISYNNNYAGRIVRILSNGDFDNSFLHDTGFDNTVLSISLTPNGKYIIGGDFTLYNGSINNRITRLNQDSSIDNTFISGIGFDSSVNHIQVIKDKYIIGGSFNTYNGISNVRYLCRLSNTGELDTSFLTNILNDTVYNVLLDKNDNLLITGKFTYYNNYPQYYVLRLTNDNRNGWQLTNISKTVEFKFDVTLDGGGNITTFKQLSSSNFDTNEISCEGFIGSNVIVIYSPYNITECITIYPPVNGNGTSMPYISSTKNIQLTGFVNPADFGTSFELNLFVSIKYR